MAFQIFRVMICTTLKKKSELEIRDSIFVFERKKNLKVEQKLTFDYNFFLQSGVTSGNLKRMTKYKPIK